MKLGIPAGVEAPLAKRLAWLIFFRLLVLAIFLVLIELYYVKGEAAGGVSSWVAIVAVCFAFTASAGYGALLRRGRGLTAVAHAQLLTDQLTWTAIVYITGGVTSGSASLYGLTCLSGAILLGTPGAISAALSGIAAYLTLCFGFAARWITPPTDQLADAYVTAGGDMVYPAFSTVMAITVVTVLGAYLSERVRAFGGSLAAATKRAEQAERLAALGKLAAGLAHEIRNPLGSIRGSIELLRTGGGLDREAVRLCELVEREAGRLNDLVTDMVDLSRPREPDKRSVDLARTARDVVDLAHRSGRGQDVAVRYEGPDELYIRADAAHMHQVLWNLVRNAIQASSAGAEVRVRLGEGEAGVELEVSDDGPGIPESARERIFDAFFSTRAHGVGIGLAVVKQVVDAHGFALAVESAAGAGTTFRMVVPKSARCTPSIVPAPLTRSGAIALLALMAAGAAPACSSGREWADPAAPVATPEGEIWWGDGTARPAESAEPRTVVTGVPVSAAAPSGSSDPVAVVLREEPFRNTYYDFPADDGRSTGGQKQVFDAECRPIATVSADFHDAVCVQGSGRLASGETISFAKRDCPCAAECPRTAQKICFEKLDPQRFPHGRGALGTAITPLRSVAVDSTVIALGTALYIPDYHGLRDLGGKAHDGCFVAEDRGSRVKGRHVDIFTGNPALTTSWNEAVPSNRGVRVVIDAARCAYLGRKKG